MSAFIGFLINIVGWLPESFIANWLINNTSTLQPIREMLGYINYFIPFYAFAEMFVGWGALMIVSIVITNIIKKVV